MPHLFGHLSKVADKPQDGAPDQGVPDAAEVHFVTVEVGVEGVNGFHRSWPLLLVPKNEVYPVVEVGTDEVAFQSLEPKSKEHEKWRPLLDLWALCTDHGRGGGHMPQDAGSAQERCDISPSFMSTKWEDTWATQWPSNSCLQLVGRQIWLLS